MVRQAPRSWLSPESFLVYFSPPPKSSFKPFQASMWVLSPLTGWLGVKVSGLKVSRGVSALLCTVCYSLMAGSKGAYIISYTSMPDESPSPRYSLLAGLNCNHLSSYASSLVSESYLKAQYRNKGFYYIVLCREIMKCFSDKVPRREKNIKNQSMTCKMFAVHVKKQDVYI